MTMKHLGRLVLLPVLCGSVSLMAAPKKLSEAVLSGDLTLVKAQLKERPEELNKIDKWGWTPLMWATLRQYVPIIKFLLANGADPNLAAEKADITIKAGATPLIICGYYGTADIAKLLLAAKADPAKEDNAGETALSYATRYRFQEVIDLLPKASQ
ncbi:MAG: ankyrin repeat domain-containing protein [Holophaga sp.]|nr:ankyrin repeat domain-containing protein [Holophaga sp.]